jgi:hypothetical protein
MSDSHFTLTGDPIVKLCECGCGKPTTLSRQGDTKRGLKKGQPQRFIRGHQGRGKPQSEEANLSRSATMLEFREATTITPTCGHPERKHYAKGLCHICWQKEWYKEHPEKQIGSSAWARRNPERMKVLMRKGSLKKYGLTIAGFEAMWEAQQGKCANPRCSATFEKSAMNRKVGGLHVDHDHVTGAVRKLLCPRCNTALGHVNDNIDLLRGLIEYLESFPE